MSQSQQGPQIDGYEILGRLGEGGMGVVWRAVQLGTRRPVALKLLGAGAFASEKARARFEREVELAARLEHPNIARVYESGLHQGIYYYAMELIEGVPLDAYVQKHRLDRRQILELLRVVCQAVQHAHQRGIIHRDLKPSNILVTADGQPHVLDFGLAKTLIAEDAGKMVSRDGEASGTPAYMSPEQAAGKMLKIDTRTDVYSLGVILYQLLTGAFPHVLTGTSYEVMRRIAEEEIVRPRSVCAAIDADVEALLMKALSRDLEGRYASAGELADEIGRYLNGDPLTARAPTAAYFLLKRIRKYRLQVSIAAAALALFAGIAVYSYVNVARERNRAVKAEEVAVKAQDGALKSADEARAAEKKAEDETARAVKAEKDALKAQEDAVKSADEAHAAEKKAVDEALRADKERDAALAADKQRAEESLRADREHDAAAVAEKKTVDEAHRADKASSVAELAERKAAAEAEATRRAGYVNNIALAQREEDLGNPEHARQLLDQCPQDLRGWEWHRLSFVGDRSILTLHGNGGSVDVVVFSPNGKQIATGGDTVRLWDATTGAEVKTFKGQQGGGRCVAFSPDGKRIVSGSSDKTLKVLNAATGTEVMTINGHTGFYCVAFSPDGKGIVSVDGDWALRLWNAATGAEVMTLKENQCSACNVAFSSDGKRIAFGAISNVQIWDTTTGSFTTIKGLPDVFFSPPDPLGVVAFSPDCKRIAYANKDGTTLKLWNAETKKLVVSLNPQMNTKRSAAFSPDGRLLALGSSDKTVKLWDATTGAEVATFKGHQGTVCCVAFSPDGKRIVSGSDDKTAKLWDVGMRADTLTLTEHGVNSFAFSPDGKQIVSGDVEGTVKLWDAATGAGLMTLRGHQNGTRCVAFSPDGKRIVSGGNDKILKLWDAVTGTVVTTFTGHEGSVEYVAFSPDGKRIVSSSAGRVLKLWNAATGAEVMTLQEAEEPAAFSPDGKQIVSGSHDGTLKLWDLATRAEDPLFQGKHWSACSVAFSPDGKRIVSGNANGIVEIWDAGTGAEIMTLKGHLDRVWCVGFSPDGKRIVSVSNDKTLKLWDAATGVEVMSFKLEIRDFVTSVAFSPDGKRIAFNRGESITVWDSGSWDEAAPAAKE